MFAFYFVARLYLLRYTVHFNCLSFYPHHYAGLMFVSVSVGHQLFMGITYCTSLPICPCLLLTVLSSHFVCWRNYYCNCYSGLACKATRSQSLRTPREQAASVHQLHIVSQCDVTRWTRWVIERKSSRRLFMILIWSLAATWTHLHRTSCLWQWLSCSVPIQGAHFLKTELL